MKFSHPGLSPLVATLLALAAPLSMAQTTATTSPVGFITLSVPGTSTTSPSSPSALTLSGLGMFNPILFQGTVDVLSGNTITNNSASFTANQYNGTDNNCFIEFLTGAKAGVILDVQTTGTSPSTITTAQSIPSGVAVNDTFCVRKHWTLGSVFGTTNQNGLFSGTSSTADQILLYNGTGYDTYFYNTSVISGVGWKKNGSAVSDPNNVVIYPDQGILVITKQSASESVVLMGAVKTGQTSVPVLPGLNVLGNVYAANMTLGDSGLFTDNTGTTGVMPGNSSTADQVLIYNSVSSTYATYYYSTNPLVGTGWVQNPPNGSAASVSIPTGSSIIIQRKAGSGFNWIAPQHPTSF